MKETVNVNIGSLSFVLDEDAYAVLRDYFEAIRSRLPEDDTETMADIEARMAEIFRERGASPMRVVTLETVRAAMQQMGDPETFGDLRNGGPAPEPEPQEPRKLRRSTANRSIAGVCGGLAEFFDCDASIVRLLTLLLIVCGGLSIWIYVILWIVIPEQQPEFNPFGKTRNNAL